jgi:hypothetical protein
VLRISALLLNHKRRSFESGVENISTALKPQEDIHLKIMLRISALLLNHTRHSFESSVENISIALKP